MKSLFALYRPYSSMGKDDFMYAHLPIYVGVSDEFMLTAPGFTQR